MLGCPLNCQDISSRYCRQRKGVRMERLDRFDKEENQWQEAVVVDTRLAHGTEYCRLPMRFQRLAGWVVSPQPPHGRIPGPGQSHRRRGEEV